MKNKTKLLLTIVLIFALLLVSAFAACDCNAGVNPNESGSSSKVEDTGSTGTGGNQGEVEGPAVVTELIITSQPTKTSYHAGEVFDAEGLALKAKWSDGLAFVVELKDCTVSPSGVLTEDDDKVTITYEGCSAYVDITVVDLPIESISVDVGNIALRTAVNTAMDFSGITVKAIYTDGSESPVQDGYTFKVDDEEVEDVSAISFTKWGTHTITVVYGEVSQDISVTVFDGFVVEAERIFENATADDKNYVEIYKASSLSKPGAVTKETEPASGGSYMGRVFKGSGIRFHVFVDEDCNAEVILRAASCYMLQDGGSWSPVVMGEEQFNRLFAVSYGSAAEASASSLKELIIPDDVVLAGSSTDNPAGDKLLYVNWKDVNFGILSLKKGDNVIELDVISDCENVIGEPVACNIDRLEIRYTEEDADETLKVGSIAITTPPTKTSYYSGERFDPTGMVVTATMSDDSTRTIAASDLVITPEIIAKDSTEITISYKGVTTVQPISVEVNAVKIKIEGENIVKNATAEDKNYVEAVRNGYQGAVGAGTTGATVPAGTTSGDKYLNGLFGVKGDKPGAVVRFHIWVDSDCTAEIKIYASSCNVVEKGSDTTSKWSPAKMGDVQFNQVFSVKFGTDAENLTAVSVSDTEIVYGGESADGKTDKSLWENWKAISLGTFNLTAGDNIIELENINSELTNLAEEIYGLNIDYLLVESVE